MHARSTCSAHLLTAAVETDGSCRSAASTKPADPTECDRAMPSGTTGRASGDSMPASRLAAESVWDGGGGGSPSSMAAAVPACAPDDSPQRNASGGRYIWPG